MADPDFDAFAQEIVDCYNRGDYNASTPAFVIATEYQKLKAAIVKHYAQKADDRCWMDDVELYKAAGLRVPENMNCVGDKSAMLENCKKFVETRCKDGQWKSYQELMTENNQMRTFLGNIRTLLALPSSNPEELGGQMLVAYILIDNFLEPICEICEGKGVIYGPVDWDYSTLTKKCSDCNGLGYKGKNNE